MIIILTGKEKVRALEINEFEYEPEQESLTIYTESFDNNETIDTKDYKYIFVATNSLKPEDLFPIKHEGLDNE